MAQGGREKQKGTPPQHGGPAKPPKDMHRYLGDLRYPSRKMDLVNQAKDRDLPIDVIHVLDRLPDKQYHDSEEVWRTVEETQ